MDLLIWPGAGLTLMGVAVLAWCVVRGLKLRRGGLPDEALRAGLQRVVAVNMAGLGLSVLGLMLVILGISLG